MEKDDFLKLIRDLSIEDARGLLIYLSGYYVDNKDFIDVSLDGLKTIRALNSDQQSSYYKFTESEKELIIDLLHDRSNGLKAHILDVGKLLISEKPELIQEKGLHRDINECSEQVHDILGIMRKLQS